MSKKLLTTLLTLCLLSTLFTVSESTYALTRPSNAVDATFTSSNIYIDGKQINFDAYLINGNNYLKLRDIAYALNGSVKQFNVIWDAAKNGIELIPSTAYAVVGGEMQQSSKVTFASPSKASLFIGTNQMPAAAYLINGNNYFKLRDIGSMLNFSVEWDGTTQSVKIDSSKPYVEETKLVNTNGPTEYLTVGELSKLFVKSIYPNTDLNNPVDYGKFMVAELYFDGNKESLYDDANDMNRLATRAELARVIVSYYLYNHEQTYFVEDINNVFTDLSINEKIDYKYCNYAVLYGLIQPTTPITFAPYEEITLEDFQKALEKAAK